MLRTEELTFGGVQWFSRAELSSPAEDPLRLSAEMIRNIKIHSDRALVRFSKRQSGSGTA